MNAVQTNRVRIWFPGDLVVLAGQVLHATHLAAQLVDVTDLTDATNALQKKQLLKMGSLKVPLWS